MFKHTRWGLAFAAVLIALCIWVIRDVPIQLGIDLQGGTELTYSLDLSRIERDRARVAEEVKDIIAKRLNAFGLKEISVSVQGQEHLVIQLPGTDVQGVENLKRQIEKSGELTFRLVAADEEQSADRQKEHEESERLWLAADREWVAKRIADPSYPVERPKPPDYIVRTEVIKEKVGDKEVFVPKPNGRRTLQNFHTAYNPATHVWEPEGVVSGRFLSAVSDSTDENMRPAVSFSFRGEGAAAFGDLTGANVGRLLAVVLDDDIMEVATIKSKITTSGQLSGNFTHDDVRGIVTILRGGSLPTKPKLISESTVGSILGQDSIESGIRAVIIGTLGVMVAMAIYYMAGGMVANFALAFNILLIVAFMVSFRQTLTLPGLAGMLLTLAMAVDANILIFERYREERKKGKPVAQAMGAGYDRAFWVIFDSNLTTIITGYVLFYLGTPEVKGFAVTLISGLFASFFTSVYVTRLLLSFLLNHGVLKDVRMMEVFSTPRIPFVKYQKRFIGGSAVLIALTWILVFARGQENYGIDFTGGARVTMNLSRSVSTELIRDRIEALKQKEPELFRDYTLQTIKATAPGESSRFALLTRAGSATALRMANAEEVPAGSAPVAPAAPAPATPVAPVPVAPETVVPAVPVEAVPAVPVEAVPAVPVAPTPVAPPAPLEASSPATPALNAAASVAEAVREPAQLVKEAVETVLAADGLLLPPAFPVLTWSLSNAPGAPVGSEALELQVNLLKAGDVTPDGIKSILNAALELDPLLTKLNREPTASFKGIEVLSVDAQGVPTEDRPWKTYTIRTNAYVPPPPGMQAERTVPVKEQVEDLLKSVFRRGSLAEKVELCEPFPQVLTVGPRVASNLQTDAIVAIFISILGIVFYLSLRFEFIYGVAGIVALIHDVMVAIGVMAVADQFLPSFSIKFNLNELAAILTIIGFSINDTIVLFDRIRENTALLAKKKYSLEDLVDMSINQTLSRTLWTSLTVLMVVVILLGFGGESVRGFAFLFSVGTVAGVYSSVFIAAPVAIWLHHRALARKQAASQAANA